MRLVLIAAVLATTAAACGRYGFDGRDEDIGPDAGVAEVDASADDLADVADTDAAPEPSPCTRGAFAAPIPLAGVSSAATDWFGTPSEDELTLFFYSDRQGGKGDVFVASRPSVDVPYDAPVRIAELSSSDYERAPTLSADGLRLILTSDRPGGVGFDLWEAARVDAAAAWSTPSLIGELSSAQDQLDPWMSPDGLDLWFAVAPNSINGGDLRRASRAALDQAFGAAVAVAELNSTDRELSPTVSSDGLEIFFASNRPGGAGGFDVWTATRATTAAPFNTPTLVAELSSPGDDFGLRLSADGNRLYLNHNTRVAGGGNDPDLYVAVRGCGP